MGVNFWQYLPGWTVPVLALLALAPCVPSVRAALVVAAQRTGTVLARPLPFAVLLVATMVVCWLLRERQLFGDSALLTYAVGSGWYFVFPDIGASFLMRSAIRWARLVPMPPVAAAQLVSCVAAPLFLYFLVRAARVLAPQRTVLAVLFLVSGGMLRVFTGHVEVYAPLLVAVALFLWRSFEYLEGRGGWVSPSVAAGLAIWLHLSGLFLLPSLLWLHWTVMGDVREAVRRFVWSVALAALPGVLFLVALFVVSAHADLARGWQIANEMLGNSADEHARRWWVRLPGGAPSAGTDYVLLSIPHVKYLANALWVLAPAALPVVLGLLVTAPRRLVATPAARFVASCVAPLVIYTLAVRPMWGPFDWDLFAMTALLLAVLALCGLDATLPSPDRSASIAALVAFQLLFVGAPFVAMGVLSSGAAGPFEQRLFHPSMADTGRTPMGEVIPWL